MIAPVTVLQEEGFQRRPVRTLDRIIELLDQVGCDFIDLVRGWSCGTGGGQCAFGNIEGTWFDSFVRWYSHFVSWQYKNGRGGGWKGRKQDEKILNCLSRRE